MAILECNNIDNPNGCKFGEFIGKELVNETMKIFNLSKRKEDTFKRKQ